MSAGAGRAQPGGGNRLALVVEDDRTSQILLEAMLRQEGYEVLAASDGVEAVACFERTRPGLIFMDILMPGMNGYEATRRIKALAGDDFVPVIFLTALSDDEALAAGIEAGGDDFLTKPYRRTVLRSRITAVERIRDLYQHVQKQREELRQLHERMQSEQEIAEKIFSRAVSAGNVHLGGLHSVLRPSTTFNGDLLLTAHRPAGGLHILLGDFTGHGLAAAIGALPVSEVFRAMTAKGFNAPDILSEANRKLRTLLPPNIFMAASFVSLSADGRSVTVWNGGMPDVLLVDRAQGEIHSRIPSSHPPLGVMDELDRGSGFHRVELGPSLDLLLYSDGLVEARGPQGQAFGQAALERALTRTGGDLCTLALDTLDAHCQSVTPDDDVSLVALRGGAMGDSELQAPAAAAPASRPARLGGSWQWALEVRGARLRSVDPVPLVIGQLQELQGLEEHRQALYTVVAELVSNALEHGILGLDSSGKRSAAGFERYYAERRRRLREVEDGYIRVELELVPGMDAGELHIGVEDSGPGFAAARSEAAPVGRLFGRGISLVRSLCASLRYEGRGNRAAAVFRLG